MTIVTRAIILCKAAIMLALSCSPAFAYMGPGAGLTAIGTLLALVGVVLLAIVGFVWYPLKRLFFTKKTAQNQTEPKRPSRDNPQ